MARVGTHQRSVHRPVRTHQSLFHRRLHRVVEQPLHNVRFVEAALAVLGKRTVVPDFGTDIQSHEPPERHVVLQLHQLPAGPHAHKIAAQHRQEQLLGRNARPAFVGAVQRCAQLADALGVHHLADAAQRVVGGDELFYLYCVEHYALVVVLTIISPASIVIYMDIVTTEILPI